MGVSRSNQLIESNQQIHAGVFDIVARSQHRDRLANGYVMGGLGVYDRKLQLTSPAIGYTTFCDPYWYVCYPAAVPVEKIVGHRSSTDFGMNFGGGVTYHIHQTAAIYAEIRYHYVWGPSIDPQVQPLSGTTSQNLTANGRFLPITVGFRF